MQPPTPILARTSWVVLAAALSCSNAPPPRPMGSVPGAASHISASVVHRATSALDARPERLRETLASSCARSCAITGTSVWCWAQSPGAARSALQPAAVRGLTDARTLACGAAHCCALRRGGAVSCWAIPASARPIAAPGPLAPAADGDRVEALAAGGTRTCAALHSGRVACWRLLDPSTQTFSPPQRVEGVDGARAVAVGSGHGCALLRDGHVRCWGGNREGQVGSEVTGDTRDVRPTEVADLPLVVELSAGARHTCARTADGEVWCWGSNANGQLGRGPFAGGPRPQRVIDLSGVEAITAGRAHSCAVLPGGSVACWGDNRTHAVGEIDPRTAPVPVAIPGVAGAARVTASCEATCAQRGDATVTCWGGRYRERGAPPGRPVPVTLR